MIAAERRAVTFSIICAVTPSVRRMAAGFPYAGSVPGARKNIHPVKKTSLIFTFHIFHKVFHTAVNTCKPAGFGVKYT